LSPLAPCPASARCKGVVKERADRNFHFRVEVIGDAISPFNAHFCTFAAGDENGAVNSTLALMVPWSGDPCVLRRRRYQPPRLNDRYSRCLS
jgi:hypothetical protein